MRFAILAAVLFLTACAPAPSSGPQHTAVPFKPATEVCFNGIIYYEFAGPTVTYAPKLGRSQNGFAVTYECH